MPVPKAQIEKTHNSEAMGKVFKKILLCKWKTIKPKLSTPNPYVKQIIKAQLQITASHNKVQKNLQKDKSI